MSETRIDFADVKVGDVLSDKRGFFTDLVVEVCERTERFKVLHLFGSESCLVWVLSYCRYIVEVLH